MEVDGRVWRSRTKSEVILSNSSKTEARICSRGEKNSFLSKWCWENWTATWKVMKLEHYPASYTKTNSKWFKT